MFNKFFRRFSDEPFKFMKKLEKPLIDTYENLTKNYPFKSTTPITKTIVGSSICIYVLWQLVPFKHMFRHFQISEYTVSRGYIHTLFTGSISHQDFGHLLPNVIAYSLFGRLIESKFGSRKAFYLMLTASLSSVVAIVVLEKILNDSVGLITPKCNGSVPAIALAVATAVRAPMVYLNPFKLKHSFRNEMFMMPIIIPVALYAMLEYYEWKLGYVEYICKI